MAWLSSYLAVLFAAAILASAVALVSAARWAVPGRASLVALSLAVAWWSLGSAFEAMVGPGSARLAWARAQYLAIPACAPLFFLFTHDYTRAEWWRQPWRRALLAVVPVLTIPIAFTNEQHHWLWRAVVEAAHGNAYAHGPWFWVVIAHSYVLLGAGTILMVRSVRRVPSQNRGQVTAFIAGALAPWAGNLLYILGVRPADTVDLTPVGFSVAALCLAWGMYRYQFLDLVPIARGRVFDSMTEAVLVIDPRLRVIDLNPAARRLIGESIEWFGRPAASVLPWWQGMLEGGLETARSVFIATNADDQHLEVDVSPIHEGRALAGWLVLMRDVSARVAGERERLALDRRLLEQQKLDSLRVVAAGISHDFNNLLATIIGNADLVAMHLPPDADLRQRLEIIVSGAQRAADLIEQMLAYAGEGRGASAPIDLEALTRETVQLVEGSIAHSLPIQYEAARGLPPIYGDPLQIGQVVLNLLINAVEAATPARALITVSIGQQEVSRAELSRAAFGTDASPGPYLFVEVRDEGPGMDEATLGRIFDPFFTTKDSGHGLGLASVQGIVRGHGGALRVESRPRQGSAFRVWFPVSRIPMPDDYVPPVDALDADEERAAGSGAADR